MEARFKIESWGKGENLEREIAISDFALQADGAIAPPTIAVNFRNSVVDPCSVSSFMEGVTADHALKRSLTAVQAEAMKRRRLL